MSNAVSTNALRQVSIRPHSGFDHCVKEIQLLGKKANLRVKSVDLRSKLIGSGVKKCNFRVQNRV
ncbi:MAG: hypothetical protein DMF62_05555 [Acidobacteria bacterium]|nr:MAG: hypothetical protein DMF62_05555 [Acidobacteriota bacterium]